MEKSTVCRGVKPEIVERSKREFVVHIITEYDMLHQKSNTEPTEEYLMITEKLKEYEPVRLFILVSRLK